LNRIIIDSDAHVVEERDVFSSRLSAKHGDNIPRIKYWAERDADWWFVADTPVYSAVGSVMQAGPDGEVVRRSNYRFPSSYDDMHPSSYDPVERAKVMDQYGIRASTTYPWLGLTGPDAYKTIAGADTEFQMQVVSAYNDWIMTWPERAPGRFIPLACIPYWEIDYAVKEIERCAEMGIKGLVMSGKPQNHGCPVLADRSWDPVWAAAQDAGLSISFHAGGGGIFESRSDSRTELLGPEGISLFATTADFMQNAIAAIELILSGVLFRYPRLNFAIVESGAGWAPFVLETMDVHYKRYTPWKSRPELFSPDLLPSDLFNRQVYTNIWYEDAKDHFTWNNLMFETDYPHPTSLDGREIAEAIDERLKGLAPEVLEDVLWRNAKRCFGLTNADIGVPEGA
jgi:predicted TIM-barrel fold metal-dependent hydrolase